MYAALGLPWIPPELREDRGEVQAALAGKLPELIELGISRPSCTPTPPGAMARYPSARWRKPPAARDESAGDHRSLRQPGRGRWAIGG